MMGAAVIGGAGFIGSHLVDELLQSGFEVTVLDNFSEGKVENLARHRDNPKLEVVRGDILDYDIVRRVVDHKTWVFHLAAMSRIQPSITDPLHAFKTNYLGTANVAEACRQAEVRRLVYSASSSAYGLKNKPPLTEVMPTDCLNPYSLSKKGGEEIVGLYHKLYGMSTVSLRYFNVYGPRHQEDGSYATVIAIFRKQKRLGQPLTIVGDGSKRRDFTFVGDVVRANMMAAMNYTVYGVLNIGTGKNYSIGEVADLIGGEKSLIPDRPAEALTTLADARLARDTLGWHPTVTLEQGLAVIDEYEKKHGAGGLITLL